MADTFTLDGLALTDNITFAVDADKGVDMAPPRARADWIGAADSETQLLVRKPKHENRKVVLPMVLLPQASDDLVHDKIALLIDKLEKASAYPDGIALTWTSGTRTITFDVLLGEIPGLPINWQSGWLSRSPEFSIELTCKPYWRGTETLTSTASTSTPFVTQTVTVTGDVPALGRLIVTDTATQSRRHVEWGLEGPLTYNAATSLLVDSDSLVVSGFSGSGAATSGAYDPNATGNSVVFSNLYLGQQVAVCGTGDLAHVGSFRVKMRVQATAGTRVRLSWRAGDGPTTSNDWATITPESRWVEVDLGSVTVPTALVGAQRWTGQIEAVNSVTVGGVHVDYLTLVPTSDGYGKARAVFAYSPGVVVGYDSFTGTTAATALGTRAAPLGGSWATSGATTDFVFSDSFSGAGSEEMVRTTTADSGPRFAILGTTNYADTEMSSRVLTIFYNTSSGDVELGVIARWTDSSNYLRAVLKRDAAGVRTFQIVQRVAGVDTTLISRTFTGAFITSGDATSTWIPYSWYRIRLLAFSSGRALAWLLDNTEQSVMTLDTASASLVTGGALATGKPGLYDRSTVPSAGVQRYYDDFAVSAPTSEPVAIYSGRNMQIRHDEVLRQDSTAAYTGRPPSYRGSRFLVPVGTSRVLVKARRADIEGTFDDNVTDATQIQIGWTPRGLAVPR